jgi:hypothetical protein
MPLSLSAQNVEQYHQLFIIPTMNHILGLGLVLKKYKCHKAYRNLRTALAVSNALTDPEWFLDQYNIRTLRRYLDDSLDKDLANMKGTQEKGERRYNISGYGYDINNCLYDIQTKLNSNNFQHIPDYFFLGMNELVKTLLT